MLPWFPSPVNPENRINTLHRLLNDDTEIDGSVVPVEVKSGKDFKKHNALNNFLASREYGVKNAVVLSLNNLAKDGPILYCPIYMTSFISEAKPSRELIDISLFD